MTGRLFVTGTSGCTSSSFKASKQESKHGPEKLKDELGRRKAKRDLVTDPLL